MNNDVLKYNIVKFICFFLITLFYQQIAGGIGILGIVPNVSFLLILSAAICEPYSNLSYSLIFGIIYDYMNGIVFGTYTLMYVLISFAAGEIYHKNFENVTIVEIIFMILGCFLYSIITTVFIALQDGGFWQIFTRISLVEFVYNSIIGIIILLIYKKIIAPSAGRRRRHNRRSAWRI